MKCRKCGVDRIAIELETHQRSLLNARHKQVEASSEVIWSNASAEVNVDIFTTREAAVVVSAKSVRLYVYNVCL